MEPQDRGEAARDGGEAETAQERLGRRRRRRDLTLNLFIGDPRFPFSCLLLLFVAVDLSRSAAGSLL